MKNTFFSFVLAALLLMTTAYAAVTANTDNLNFYAYGDGLASSQNVVLTNTDLTHNVTVKFRGELTFRSDSQEKINISATVTEIKVVANKTATITVKTTTSMSKIESGMYTGNFEVLDKTTNATLLTIPATVTVPGLKLTISSTPSSKIERGQGMNVTLNYKNLGKYSDLSDVNLVEFAVYDKDGDLLYNENDDAVLDISDESLNDLGNGESDKYNEEFSIPYNFDTSRITIEATVTACNDEYTGECFEVSTTKNLTEDNKDDKILISKASFSPASLECGVNKAKLNVEVINLGNRKQDLILTIKNQQTGTETALNNAENIKLDNDYEGDSYTANYDEYLTLNGLKTGANLFTLYVDYGLKNPASKDIAVNLASCTPVTTSTTTTNTSSNNQIIVQTPQGTLTMPADQILGMVKDNLGSQQLPTSNPTYVTLKDVSGSGFSLDSEWVLPAAIGVGALIIGIIVTLLIVPRH